MESQYKSHSETHILIVDDNSENCDILNRRLSKKGFQCQSVFSGTQALESVDRSPPDLILLDIMMPGIDGIETLTRLRQTFNSVTLPILMVTAKNADCDIVEAFAKGANDYIEKPIDFPVLLARVEHHLNHKHIDDELTRSKQKLEEQNRLLDLSNQHKINFLTSMSHELRTPLNAILGYSEVLIDGLIGELSPKQKEYCTEIFNSGSYLLVIINDLLDLSKIEAGKLSLDNQPTHLPSLLEGVVSMVKEKAERHKITLKTDVSPSVASYTVDPIRIKQILVNLLTNAIKYTKSGKTVTTSIYVTDTSLCLSVSDQGFGIADEDLDRIFLPFEQSSSTVMQKNIEGTGLGLALVKKLAELYHGSIQLETEKEKGSTFTVSLPLKAIQ